MASEKKPETRSGGMNITKSKITGDVVGGDKIGGDKVGGDKIGGDKNTSASSLEFAELMKLFTQIRQKIDERPEDASVNKAEIAETVEKIEQEVKKGEDANPTKVERWLKFLALMADDIFQVTASTLISPLAGVANAIQLIAKKAKEEKG